jgi:UDP-N-acetylglucosamine 4-epimerase
VNELYADVYSRVYGFHTIGLRYFNVFGPKQNPNNPYAAVIPIFCKHFIEGNQPTINGDGLTSRDFTFVENAVQANIKALLFGLEVGRFGSLNQPNLQTPKPSSHLQTHEVFNTACGDQVTLNEMVEMLKDISGKNIAPTYGAERKGDVKHSKASIEKISNFLNYEPKFRFQKGLEIVFDWYNSEATSF